MQQPAQLPTCTFRLQGLPAHHPSCLTLPPLAAKGPPLGAARLVGLPPVPMAAAAVPVATAAAAATGSRPAPAYSAPPPTYPEPPLP